MEKKLIISGNEIKEIKIKENAKICYYEKNKIYIIDSNRKLHRIKINKEDLRNPKTEFEYETSSFDCILQEEEKKLKIYSEKNFELKNFLKIKKKNIHLFSHKNNILLSKIDEISENQKKNNFDQFFLTKIGYTYTKRTILKIKINPLNENIIAILFTNNVLEIFNLASDIDDPLIYLNLSKKLKFDEIENFSFMKVMNSNYINSIEELNIFFVTRKKKILFFGPILFPEIFFDDNTISEFENKIENLEDFEIRNNLENLFKNLNNSYSASLLALNDFNESMVSSKNNLFKLKGEIDKYEKIHFFEVLKFPKNVKLFFILNENETQLNLDIYFIPNLIFPFCKNQKFFIFSKINFNNFGFEIGQKIIYYFDSNVLWICQNKKMIKIDFNFFSDFSFEKIYSEIKIDFLENIKKNIVLFNLDLGNKIILDFYPTSFTKFIILTKNTNNNNCSIFLIKSEVYIIKEEDNLPNKKNNLNKLITKWQSFENYTDKFSLKEIPEQKLETKKIFSEIQNSISNLNLNSATKEDMEKIYLLINDYIFQYDQDNEYLLQVLELQNENLTQMQSSKNNLLDFIKIFKNLLKKTDSNLERIEKKNIIIENKFQKLENKMKNISNFENINHEEIRELRDIEDLIEKNHILYEIEHLKKLQEKERNLRIKIKNKKDKGFNEDILNKKIQSCFSDVDRLQNFVDKNKNLDDSEI